MTLRARLATLGILSFLALLAAAASVLVLARSSDQQRIERAREGLVESLDLVRERLDEGGELPRRRGGFAGVIGRDGVIYGGGRALPPRVRSALDALALRARARGEPVFEQVELGEGDGSFGPRRRTREGVLVIAARALPEGGAVWSARVVPVAPGLRRGRYAVLLLVLLAVVLVGYALRTLVDVQRDTASLQRSLGALGEDLSAPVESPRLGELSRVADGLRALARSRAHAESERVRLESELAARERLASLGRVVAGVAHEVRNPLASMKLKVDLARVQPAAKGELEVDLRELGDEIARLDRLITDLLVVAGRRSGPVASCELGALAAKRAALLEGCFEQQGVRVVCEGEARARVDADGVARVIDNLLRNAAQASPRGESVRIRVREEGDGAVIEVEDRGPGVDPARLGELFEPFFTTRAEGTGLGLAMSRAVAEAHGGALRYARVEGSTRFTLTLPA